MNGAECGECGNIQCTCDPYPGKIGYIFHQLNDGNHTVEYKTLIALKGILMVLDKIEQEKHLSEEFVVELKQLVPFSGFVKHKRWWQFWK